jgi:hypothetical protein
MKISRLTPILLIAAIGASALPAAAAPRVGHENPMNCRVEAKKTYRLAKVVKRGLPVRVTCDGPETIDSLLSFAARKQDHDWLMMHPGGVPGISTGTPIELSEAGTVTHRSFLTPRAAGFLRRYPRAKLSVFLGVACTDGSGYMCSVGGETVTVVR